MFFARVLTSLGQGGGAIVVALALLAPACDQPVKARSEVPPAQIQRALDVQLIPVDGTNIIITCPGGCDDRNPCTDDFCDQGICEHTPNAASCDDADPCTANACLKGACIVTTTATCRGDQCNTSVCDGRGGCQKTPKVGTACTDSNACSYGETCDANGACTGGRPVTCTSDACTTRTCNGTATCTNTPKTGSACSDNNPCTANDTCDNTGVCRPGTLVTCQDDACNTRVCDGNGGCKATPKVNAACNDGDPCSYGDVCDAMGVCQAGAKITCANDACNTRVCNGTMTCKVTPRTGNRCDDGNACSFDDVCNEKGACAGTPLTCLNDETAERTCNGGPTCTVKPKPGVACDDGDPCTQGDVRVADGTCRGMPYSCKLGECLVSSVCDGKGGCTSVSKPDETPCDADKSQCTPRDICRGGACVPDPRPVKCVERDCNTVACNALTGNCEYTATSGGSCGVSGCFAAGTCNEGVCSGTPKDCRAFAGPCSEGICDAATGECVAAPKANGTNCSPGGMCAAQAACAFGVCELAAATCPAPSSACKVAACNPGDGKCTEAARPAGAPCDPGNSCVSEAVCDAQGACVGTPAANGEPCTAAGGRIGACVSGACVASGGGGASPVDAGGVDASTPVMPASQAKKSGCSFAPGAAPSGLGLAGLLVALVGLMGLRRRR